MKKNTKIIIICLISLLLFSGLIFIFVTNVSTYKKTLEKSKDFFSQKNEAECLDGKGADYYFKQTELANLKNISELNLTNEKLVAKFYQVCDEFTYEIKKDNKFIKVDPEDFTYFLNDYDAGCNNCLFVQRVGWPFFGEIYKKSNDRQICDTGEKEKRNCLELKTLQ